MKKNFDYWETLSPTADLAIEKLTESLLRKEISVGRLFREICKLQYTEEDSDICKETMNKVFDFIVDNNIETFDNALVAYDENWIYDIDDLDTFLKS